MKEEVYLVTSLLVELKNFHVCILFLHFIISGLRVPCLRLSTLVYIYMLYSFWFTSAMSSIHVPICLCAIKWSTVCIPVELHSRSPLTVVAITHNSTYNVVLRCLGNTQCQL